MRTRVILIAIVSIASLLTACLFGGSSGNNENNANNANNDPNLCGNGRIDPGELCDPCDKLVCPSDGCGIWAQTGSAETCDLACVRNGDQTACVDGDPWCPQDCREANDDDCSDECGNGVVDLDEECDPCPDVCEELVCEPVTQTGDPTTCTLRCDPLPVPDGCCGGELCPDTMACVNDECIERGCVLDSDCPVGELCDEGACVMPLGCTRPEDCLPWQNCTPVGSCVTPDTCETANDQAAWCAHHHFTPGTQSLDCYEPAGEPDNCVEYMPRVCQSNDQCAPWEHCPMPAAGDCIGEMCVCVIPQECSDAKDSEVYCVYQTGDPASVCGGNGGCL